MERDHFGGRLALNNNLLAVTSTPSIDDSNQSHLGACFVVDINNTDNIDSLFEVNVNMSL